MVMMLFDDFLVGVSNTTRQSGPAPCASFPAEEEEAGEAAEVVEICLSAASLLMNLSAEEAEGNKGLETSGEGLSLGESVASAAAGEAFGTIGFLRERLSLTGSDDAGVGVL